MKDIKPLHYQVSRMVTGVFQVSFNIDGHYQLYKILQVMLTVRPDYFYIVGKTINLTPTDKGKIDGQMNHTFFFN